MEKTWKEFKDEVDKWLEENGYPQTVEIEYIDFSYPDHDEPQNIHHDVQLGLSIS